MANIKKYNGSTWENTTARKYETKSEIIVSPTTIYADGSNITTYTIKGNTVQNGTPTPSNPVGANGVGVRMENLLDFNTWCSFIQNVRGDGIWTTTSNSITITSVNDQDAFTRPQSSSDNAFHIPVKPNTTYTVSANLSSTADILFVEKGEFVSSNYHKTGTWTTKSDTTFLTLRCGVKSTEPLGTSATVSNIMLAEGSTAKSYEPYGYKIPISSGGVATNIYLGSTQTVRAIKKYVFTGEEDITDNYGITMVHGLFNSEPFKVGYMALSDRYTYNPIQSGLADGLADGEFALQGVFGTQNIVYNVAIKDLRYPDATSFKTFLQNQYAAGTPVTVWYVLATSETAAVNEPLMKIGTYADTLSNAASIPTTEGANSITVDTTVQPSEFTATWTGWHDASVKEWDGSQWNE